MTRIQTVPLTVCGISAFEDRIGDPLCAESIDTIQVNIGLTCNLACRRCHVEASPKRTEQMSWETMTLVLDAARRSSARTIDITGGKPAINTNFRRFVTRARFEGFDIVVRTDLTIMLE